MIIEQFLDKDLAHLSYAIVSEGEVILIDPGRDPEPYFDFAKKNNSKVIAVFETHPHADFVSGHKELQQSGAAVYLGELTGAHMHHYPLRNNQIIKFGNVQLKALLTPGHSPDSLSFLLFDEEGRPHAVFTGDTLFIGDVGRPDLRESAGNIHAAKENLARQMYHSLRDVLMLLPDDVIVFPAHTAGSLCGKSMSKELVSTMGKQKVENYALQPMEENTFVEILLSNQPLIPKYFPYDVELNRRGALPVNESISKISIITSPSDFVKGVLVIDSRSASAFKSGHLKNAINIQYDGKFETWLGSVIAPEESFYLIAANESNLAGLLKRAAKIGYEVTIKGSLVQDKFKEQIDLELDLKLFADAPQTFTILDIREKSETDSGKIFEDAILIPLSELRERISEVPGGMSVVVHCAGGYRSAIGASILSPLLNDQVFDLGEAVGKFIKVTH